MLFKSQAEMLKRLNQPDAATQCCCCCCHSCCAGR
jgi:hypothetical protein